MESVTGQPIKKIEFFRCPQSLPGVAPLTKKPEDSGYEIAWATEGNHLVTILVLQIFYSTVVNRVLRLGFRTGTE